MLALLEGNSKRVAAFNRSIKLLAGAGLTAVTLTTLKQLPPHVMDAAYIVLLGVWGVFCFELLLRIRHQWHLAPRYLLSLYGALDAITVSVPAAGLVAGLGRRDVALLCGVWLVKFARETTALRLLRRVLVNESRNLLGVAWVFVIVLFLAALLAHALERANQPEVFGSLPSALWWAVATLTTTGYGDVVPKTFAGRVLAGAVMTSGIAVFALWAGILATGFAKEVRRHDFLRNWELVARVPMFAKLGAQELAEIVHLLRPRTASPGSVIMRKGDPGEQMYFIVEGEVAVAMEPPIRLGPGSYFGELALITGEPRTATITAATEVSLLVLDISDFHLLTARNPEMAAAINAEAERRLAALKKTS